MEDKIYKTGRIYKLYSQINEYYYIGSTHNTLRHRLYGHKGVSSRVGKKVSDWIDDIGADNLMITEIVAFTNLTKKQLLIHEDEEVKKHLKLEFCMNTNRVYIAPEDRSEYRAGYLKQWMGNNKDHKQDQDKRYRESHKEELKEYFKLRYENNKEAIAEAGKQRYEANKEAFAVRSKIYRDANKEALSKQSKIYRDANKEAIAEKRKQPIYCQCCGTSTTILHYLRHIKTMKHITNFIQY